MLKVPSPWIELLVTGQRKIEIMPAYPSKMFPGMMSFPKGTPVQFQHATSGLVLGGAVYKGVTGPMTKEEWAATRQLHCEMGDEPPFDGYSYAWHFGDAYKLRDPFAIEEADMPPDMPDMPPSPSDM